MVKPNSAMNIEGHCTDRLALVAICIFIITQSFTSISLQGRRMFATMPLYGPLDAEYAASQRFDWQVLQSLEYLVDGYNVDRSRMYSSFVGASTSSVRSELTRCGIPVVRIEITLGQVSSP